MISITFTLRCDTLLGENVYITGDIDELKDREGNPLPMAYRNSGWKITINTPTSDFQYYYLVKRDGELVKTEQPLSRPFQLPNSRIKSPLVFDTFSENRVISKAMRSAVFANALRNHSHISNRIDDTHIPIIFNTQSDKIDRNYSLAISGDTAILGTWVEADMVEMDGSHYPNYTHIADASKINFPLEYKYVIFDKKNETVICWEEGSNRYINPTLTHIIDAIIINDNEPKFNRSDFKGAGTTIPVFSLRTQNSFGCGEFSDLKEMADWVSSCGQKIIQTLPINDTSITKTWKDSYPYSAISVFALHPIYISLEKIGEIDDVQKYETEKEELNSHKFVDYGNTIKYKFEFLKELYDKQKKSTFQDEHFLSFYKENEYWLKPYAVFCLLRDKFGTSDFSQWKKDSIYAKEKVSKYFEKKSKDKNELGFHIFIQYHLHKQLKEAIEYAHSIGVSIKGDIPIGVNRHSVETWMYPNLFDCNGQAGAPPDDFSRTGQNWGFPIYNWKEMEKDGYRWWKLRFEKMSEYFDAYRIDHILGFFRIFRIPTNQTIGLLGQFSPSLPMTETEIKKFGLNFNKERFCQPYIIEAYLDSLFGKDATYVKDNYLMKDGDQYKLKESVKSQHEITKLFAGKDGERDIKIKEGLMILTCQVLFIEDIDKPHHCHPRIATHQSFAFRHQDIKTKEILSKIYDYYYYRRQDEFWKEQALKRLPSLTNATNLLSCGEDLGMLPFCVPEVMKELEMLSLEIQRMPKEMGKEFGDLSKNPYLSVCTTSTHDMSTMRAWWEEDRARTQRFFNNELNQYGMAPLFCEPWICQQIIEKHLNCPSMWVILPIQDWISIDGNIRWKETFSERINDPANPNNYWRYRLHLNIDELAKNEVLKSNIRSIISQSGR